MGSTFYSKADTERERIKSPVQYSELNGAFIARGSSKMIVKVENPPINNLVTLVARVLGRNTWPLPNF